MKSVLLLVDVIDWAWDIKAKQIKRYLSDEFNIQIRYVQKPKTFKENEKFDLYFSFDCPHVKRFNAKRRQKITGATSHTYSNMKNYLKFLKETDYHHANSVLLQKELEKLLKKKVFYVPNGVDEKLFSFKERDISKEFTVGYVGKNTTRKGYQQFIVPACKKAGVKLKAQTCKFSSKNVIKHQNIHNFYNDVDCIIVASDMDGTPNQLLEAASSGRTFISNKIGNAPELYNNINGFIVDRNIESYVEKIIWLKNNRETCKKMGCKARKEIEENWTWRIQAENYRNMFNSILKGE